MEARYTTKEIDLITVMEYTGVTTPSNGIDLGNWLARIEEPIMLVGMAPNDPEVKITTHIFYYAVTGTNNRMFNNKWYRAFGDCQGDGMDPPLVRLKPL